LPQFPPFTIENREEMAGGELRPIIIKYLEYSPNGGEEEKEGIRVKKFYKKLICQKKTLKLSKRVYIIAK
jgi:hypothetical protein